MDLRFDLAKKEANYNADKSDEQVDFSEGIVSDDFNAQIGQIQLGQENELAGWNLSAMSAGASEGDALSQAAASGVRSGSSMSEAIDLQSAVNSWQLQMAQDTSRAVASENLRSATAGLNESAFGFQVNRDAANYLRDSFEAGGSEYELYKTTRQNRVDEYQDAIDEINDAIEEAEDWKRNTLGAVLELHGLGGLQTGMQVESFVSNFVPNTYNTGGGTGGESVSTTKTSANTGSYSLYGWDNVGGGSTGGIG